MGRRGHYAGQIGVELHGDGESQQAGALPSGVDDAHRVCFQQGLGRGCPISSYAPRSKTIQSILRFRPEVRFLMGKKRLVEEEAGEVVLLPQVWWAALVFHRGRSVWWKRGGWESG